MGMESHLKLKDRGLNEESMSTAKEMGECQQENERPVERGARAQGGWSNAGSDLG